MQRYRLTSIASFFALALTLKANAAGAQPADPNAAAADYRKAYAAMAKEDWPKARELLLKVWNEKNSYDVAASLGQVEFKLEHYAAAARYMAFAIANVAPSEKPEFIERLKKGLREVRLRVGSIRVTVNEPAAEVLAGDEVMGTSPLAQEVFLDPGRHVVVARKGERSAKADVLAKAGEGFEVTLNLPAEATPLGPTSGLGAAPPPPVMSAEEGATPTDAGSASNDRDGRPRLAILGVGGGLTLLAATVGVVYAVRGSSRQSEVDRLKGEAQQELGGNCASSSSEQVCRDLATAADERNSANSTARVAFIASGVMLAGTAATYFLWPKRKEKAAARIVPIAAPRFAGLTVLGEF